jgi:pimeloyl-ACP methyl ester carboxylesterase
MRLSSTPTPTRAVASASRKPYQMPPTPPRKGFVADAWESFKDVREATSFLIGGLMYRHGAQLSEAKKAEHPPLRDVPDVVLQRPLVFVPGWNTETEKWDPLLEKLLASGENGPQAFYLKEGSAYLDRECTQRAESIPADAKLFVNCWDSRKSPPDVTSPQLGQNLELLNQQLSGAKCDLVGYSMGGLASRHYLAHNQHSVGKLLILGTPNQGTRFAQMAGRILERDIGWAISFSGLSVADLPAMKWLAAGSPRLEELNSKWPATQANLEDSMIVGSSQHLTPAVGFIPWAKGDGMVESKQLELPETKIRVFSGDGFLHHGALVHDSRVYREMTRFFGAREVDPPASK